jgi:hypothetical protein
MTPSILNNYRSRKPGIGVADEFDLPMGIRPQHAGYIS